MLLCLDPVEHGVGSIVLAWIAARKAFIAGVHLFLPCMLQGT
jgi:hypothetical protein